MEIGERLRYARQACGLGQKEVAEALGIGRSSLIRYETGEQTPNDVVLAALSGIYQVKPGSFRDERFDLPQKSQKLKVIAKLALDCMREGRPIGLKLDDYPEPIATAHAESGSLAPSTARASVLPLIPSPMPSVNPVAREVDAVSERIKIVLASKPELRSIPGVPDDVLQALQSGLVIPTSRLMPSFGEATHVSPDLYWSGQERSTPTTE